MPKYAETQRLRLTAEDHIKVIYDAIKAGVDIWETDTIPSLRYILTRINDEEQRLAINRQHRKDYPEQYEKENT